MNFLYHIDETRIKCPYCDKECSDDDHSVSEIEEWVIFECEHCEKTFFAQANIAYTTYSDCKLNDVEHEFESSESHPTVFNCKNCYHWEVKNELVETKAWV